MGGRCRSLVGEGHRVTPVEQGGEALDPGPVGGWIRVRSAAAPGTGPAARTEAMRARIVRPGLVEVPVE
jgi:flagella basal body P-ring formation protein FlgA